MLFKTLQGLTLGTKKKGASKRMPLFLLLSQVSRNYIQS